MGKSLVLSGLRAYDIGFGNVYGKNEQWILQVDKEIFETNFPSSSWIGYSVVWLGSYFNNGDNIFSEKVITSVRGYFRSDNIVISFGYYDGEKFTSVISQIVFLRGYQEMRFVKPYTIPKNCFMAIKIEGQMTTGGEKLIGFTYSGYNYKLNTGSEGGANTSKLFMDFKVIDRIEMYEKLNGYLLATKGGLSPFSNGKVYKYSLTDVDTISITGRTTVDLNGVWALYQLYKHGVLIKSVAPSQNDYTNFYIDVSEADEIWMIGQSGIDSPFEITVVNGL